MGASAEDLAMFGGDDEPPTSRSSVASGASAADLALFAGDDEDRPSWLTKGKRTPEPPATESRPFTRQEPNLAENLRAEAKAIAPSIGQEIAQPFKDLGNSILSANRGATNVLTHPIDTLGNPAFRREAMRGANDTIMPWAGNRLVEKLGGPAEYSAADEEAAPDARNLGGYAAIPLPNAISLGAKGVAMGARKIAAGAEDRAVARALADIEEGATKRAKAGIREANKGGAAERSLRANPELRADITSHPTVKTDAKLRESAESIGRRASAKLDDIYANADKRSEIVVERAPVQRQLGPMPGADPDLPGATRPPARTGRALLGEADDIAPTVNAPDRGYHLNQNARVAEARAQKAEDLLRRHERAGAPVNPELRATYDRRQTVREVAAREQRLEADRLRVVPDGAHDTNVPPGGRPAGVNTDRAVSAEYLPPGDAGKAGSRPRTVNADVTSPAPRAPGTSTGAAVKNMDRSIAELRKGTSEQRAVADQLQSIRNEFAQAYGDDAIVPSRALRAEQTAYQKQGYGKAIPGTPDYAITNAKILANRQASKDVGDVVVKHVTGMDYKAARAAAEADPKSLAGKFMRANDDVMVSNRIQTLVDSRAGSNHGAPHRLTALLQGVKQGVGVAAIGSVLGPEAAGIAAGVGAAIKAAPYVRRGAEAVATKLAPAIAPLAAGGVRTTLARNVPTAATARVLQADAASTSVSRKALAQQAIDDPDATPREKARALQVLAEK